MTNKQLKKYLEANRQSLFSSYAIPNPYLLRSSQLTGRINFEPAVLPSLYDILVRRMIFSLLIGISSAGLVHLTFLPVSMLLSFIWSLYYNNSCYRAEEMHCKRRIQCLENELEPVALQEQKCSEAQNLEQRLNYYEWENEHYSTLAHDINLLLPEEWKELKRV